MTIEKVIDRASAEIGCDPRAIWALAQVESGGGQALHRFEPHVFHGLTGRRARSYAAAERIDREAAAMASSWGVFHVMGRWYQYLGYESAHDMAVVLALVGNVDAQVASVVDYCTEVEPRAGSALRALDARALALAYNGPAGIERRYDVKWHTALARAGGSAAVVLRVGDEGPDVRKLQDALIGLGYDAIVPDAHFGARTYDAVIDLQRRLDLKVDGIVGNKTWTALERPVVRPPPSAGDKVEVAVRDAPVTAVGGSGLIATILGYLGWPEAAGFLHRLAGGDFGRVGDAIVAALPFVIGAVFAVFSILLVIYIIREVRNGRQDRDIARRFDSRDVVGSAGQRADGGPVLRVRAPDHPDLGQWDPDRAGAGRADPARGGRGGLFRDRRARAAPGVLRSPVNGTDHEAPFTIG